MLCLYLYLSGVSLETTFNFAEYIFQHLLNSYQPAGFAITQVAVVSSSTKLVTESNYNNKDVNK